MMSLSVSIVSVLIGVGIAILFGVPFKRAMTARYATMKKRELEVALNESRQVVWSIIISTVCIFGFMAFSINWLLEHKLFLYSCLGLVGMCYAFRIVFTDIVKFLKSSIGNVEESE